MESSWSEFSVNVGKIRNYYSQILDSFYMNKPGAKITSQERHNLCNTFSGHYPALQKKYAELRNKFVQLELNEKGSSKKEFRSVGKTTFEHCLFSVSALILFN